MRKNANKGKILQDSLDSYHKHLLRLGEADINERQIGTKLVHGKMIYTKREGFDYQGTLRGGRSICVEAKMEKGTTLRVDPKNKSGLRLHQLKALVRNHKLGALVGVVWMMEPHRVYAIGGHELDALLSLYIAGEVKSIKATHIAESRPSCRKNPISLIEYIPQLFELENRI